MRIPADSGREDGGRLVIGRIHGVYGVRGWVKVFSYCRPRENIFSYQPWLIQQDVLWQSQPLLAHRQQGRKLLVLFADVSDRESAQRFIGRDIAVKTESLPGLSAGEYYWSELIGMEVFDRHGNRFGRVHDIQETGANDVLFVDGDRPCLIPLVQEEVVRDVDLENRRITVDWNPEYI